MASVVVALGFAGVGVFAVFVVLDWSDMPLSGDESTLRNSLAAAAVSLSYSQAHVSLLSPSLFCLSTGWQFSSSAAAGSAWSMDAATPGLQVEQKDYEIHHQRSSTPVDLTISNCWCGQVCCIFNNAVACGTVVSVRDKYCEPHCTGLYVQNSIFLWKHYTNKVQ